MAQDRLTPAATHRSWLSSDVALVSFGIILVMAVPSYYSENFLTVSNLESVINGQSIIAIMAVGQLLAVLIAGIDISVGATFGLAGTVAAIMMSNGYGVFAAAVAALVVGTLAGAITGFIISTLRIAPFIATLGMMGILRGTNLIITGAQSMSVENKSFLLLYNTQIGWFSLPVVLMLAIAVIAHLFLIATVPGGRIFAMGGDEEGARMLGVNVGGMKVFVYAVCGFLAAFGGLIGMSKVEATYPWAGQGYEFEVIASVLVGGAAMQGGRGSVAASILGAMFIGLLKSAILQMDISQYWQQAVNGLAIIVVIMISSLLSRRR